MASQLLVLPSPDQPKKTSLSELPNELLVHICESIPSDYDEQCQTFAALAKVNRRFQSIVTPLLYRDLYVCCARHLQLLGRTILSNADRAKLVKSFGDRRERFLNSSGRTCPTVWNVFALDKTLEDVLKMHCPQVSDPITPAVFTYALACLCLNLQQLEVSQMGDLLIQRLLEEGATNAGTATPLQHIRYLSIIMEGVRQYHMHHISLLFTIPSLQILTIDMAALSTDEELMPEPVQTIWQCHHGSSSVQELALERCGLPATWIAEMILSCKTLRHFHLEHYYWDSDTTHIVRVVQALQTHKGTLSDIRINELNGCRMSSAIQQDPSKLVSFVDFASLKCLDIPLGGLSTRSHQRDICELLPSGLHTLTLGIRSAREGPSDAFFISLANATATHLTLLESVEAICRIEQYHPNGYLPLHFCHLRRLFASSGVEFLYFLEFVSCEFKAAYMEPLLANMRLAGPDGCELADRSSLEVGCLTNTLGCYSRSAHAHESKRYWGYMQAWTGPSEFEVMT
ncbi:hypothetical protein FB567DRAFT_589873 [Paraphoma chrysanthemicola]|uniref:F-box domain-containing protein n=1 Tax=Paraphoma chrysanthemicola TaxID=798071 RepID=A0A8K0W0X3_9PLEO|nr:hypothetical protein FB567DRAFT_589873 [Paraphoma chrysanthemicola]